MKKYFFVPKTFFSPTQSCQLERKQSQHTDGVRPFIIMFTVRRPPDEHGHDVRHSEINTNPSRPLTRPGQSLSFLRRVPHHANPLAAHSQYLIRQIRAAERRCQSFISFDVGAQNRTPDLLHERLHEPFHSVVELVISQSLKNKKDRREI